MMRLQLERNKQRVSVRSQSLTLAYYGYRETVKALLCLSCSLLLFHRIEAIYDLER